MNRYSATVLYGQNKHHVWKNNKQLRLISFNRLIENYANYLLKVLK